MEEIRQSAYPEKAKRVKRGKKKGGEGRKGGAQPFQ